MILSIQSMILMKKMKILSVISSKIKHSSSYVYGNTFSKLNQKKESTLSKEDKKKIKSVDIKMEKINKKKKKKQKDEKEKKPRKQIRKKVKSKIAKDKIKKVN